MFIEIAFFTLFQQEYSQNLHFEQNNLFILLSFLSVHNFFLIFLLNIENWSFLGGAPTSTVSLPSVSLSVHCTPYFRNCTSWSLFLVRMCKMMISPSVFFFSFFFNFDFFGRYGGKMAKNSPKWKIKITSITHPISGTV